MMLTTLILLSISYVPLMTASSEKDPLLAYTESGYVRGRYNTDIFNKVIPIRKLVGDEEKWSRYWAGIPFAAPPIGSLRFKSPQPFEQAWDPTARPNQNPEGDVFSAGSFPPPCPQNFLKFRKQSEDCLKLNVFAPPVSRTPPGTRLPVIVWIYGGAYNVGDSHFLGVNNARRLVEVKDVIVVTFNYRVGAFGFFSSDMPTQRGANAGIEDQRMALEWIHRNIEHFHGDPSRVTITGGSAGAQSVLIHMTSPKTRSGLFQRAVSLSAPVGIAMRTPEAMYKTSQKLASKLGCLSDNVIDMGCMSAAPMSEILKATKDMWSAEAPSELINPIDPDSIDGKRHTENMEDANEFWPSLDGDVIVGNLMDMFRDGRYKKGVDLILGYAKDEGGLWMSTTFDKPIVGTIKAHKRFSPETYVNNVQYIYGSKLAPSVLKEYPVHDDVDGNMQETVSMMTDNIFSCPNRRLALDVSSKRPNRREPRTNVYMYEWVEPGFMPFGVCRTMACHGSEAPYIFHTMWPIPGKRKHRLLAHFFNYWTNFATTGNPNQGTLEDDMPAWPLYNAGDKRRMLLGGKAVSEVKGDETESKCRMWENEVKYH